MEYESNVKDTNMQDFWESTDIMMVLAREIIEKRN
jgi:hypothetical protein